MSRIAVDLMGGDNAPQAILGGIFLFHKICPEASFLLYGNEACFDKTLADFPGLSAACQIVHTDEVITAHTKPSAALRSMPRSSMRMALESVALGQADGAVSAGNTGAYMGLSKLVLKTIGGVDRPAIASQIPTQRGESILLDLGGTLEASARNLVEYAWMGHLFARQVLGLPSPSLGLLNVGREENKGNDTLQRAFAQLAQAPLNFYGFVEGHDIALGTVDVIVTDGFTGNIAIKTSEGMAQLCMNSLKACFADNLHGRLVGSIAQPFLRRLKAQFDPRAHNGAIWLGLNGVAVKSHGGTDSFGFAHALEMAHDMIQHNIVHSIETALVGRPESAV
jgi:phosphate acyltransferase